MKTLYAFFLAGIIIFCLTNNLLAQTNIFPSTGAAGIGTVSPDPSSLLDVVSVSKGILIPRMTKTQRDAIATPSTGLLIYQTNSTPGFYYYNGTTWVAISTKGANTSLSNLAVTTSINQNLLPNATSTFDLGSSTLKWRDVYTGSVKFSDGTQQITASKWITNGSNMYFSGAVGIGISSPAYKLDISGDINLANGNALRIAGTPVFAVNTILGNTAVGSTALLNNTSGYSNVAVGIRALFNNTSGHDLVAVGDSALFNQSINNSDDYQNTALGSKTLYSNTSGYENTATGTGALYSNITGYSNCATGRHALWNNLTGFDNTATGNGALFNNTDGQNNTATGFQALLSNTNGYSNVAVGIRSLFNNTDGHNLVAVGDSALFNQSVDNSNNYANTALGTKTLFSNTSGYNNMAAGTKALYSNSTGHDNTATGRHALYFNLIGFDNTANGVGALFNNINGQNNTASGYQALFTNTTGNNNTAIGTLADVSKVSLTNATAIGYNATVDTSNKVRIGNASVTRIGGQVSWTTYSDGRYKKNIKEDVKGLSFINSLRPITYTVDINSLNAYYDKGRKHDSAYEKMKADMQPSADEASKIVYSGFVAQEVEATAKKLNYDFSGVDKPGTKDGLYGLRYSDFVVPLVKAVQELSKQNDSLKENNSALLSDNKILHQQLNDINAKINQIENAMSQCCTSFSSALNSSNNASSIIKNSDQPSLEQNVPNPFDGSCYINYYIPSGAHNAQLRITDVSGHTLKSFSLITSGYGKQTIYGSELTSGMYQYSLLIDGKLIDTKKMVLAR